MLRISGEKTGACALRARVQLTEANGSRVSVMRIGGAAKPRLVRIACMSGGIGLGAKPGELDT